MEQRKRLSDEKLAELGDKVKEADAAIKEAEKLDMRGDTKNEIIEIMKAEKLRILKEIEEQKKIRRETNEAPSKKSDMAEDGRFMAEDGSYVVLNKDTINTVMQKLTQNMDKANEEAEKALQKIDRKIAEVDLQYAKMLVKEDIDTLKIAKIILEKKEKER